MAQVVFFSSTGGFRPFAFLFCFLVWGRAPKLFRFDFRDPTPSALAGAFFPFLYSAFCERFFCLPFLLKSVFTSRFFFCGYFLSPFFTPFFESNLHVAFFFSQPYDQLNPLYFTSIHFLFFTREKAFLFVCPPPDVSGPVFSLSKLPATFLVLGWFFIRPIKRPQALGRRFLPERSFCVKVSSF